MASESSGKRLVEVTVGQNKMSVIAAPLPLVMQLLQRMELAGLFPGHI